MRWIIGDIHGMLRPLEALIASIDRHDKDHQLLFVGDYVNRGPDSKGVIDLLLSLKNANFIRGNHDDIFDHILSNMSYAGKPGSDYREMTFRWFMQHGLDKTFLSYGIPQSALTRALQRPTEANLNFLADSVPMAHRSFIRNLPMVLEHDDLFIAHAKWEIMMPTMSPALSERLDSEPVRYTLLWGRFRDDEVRSEKAWERTGYFGHTPVDTYLAEGEDLLPVVGPKIVLLDTAAALLPRGRLTAVCHESGTFLQSDPSGTIVKNT